MATDPRLGSSAPRLGRSSTETNHVSIAARLGRYLSKNTSVNSGGAATLAGRRGSSPRLGRLIAKVGSTGAVQHPGGSVTKVAPDGR